MNITTDKMALSRFLHAKGYLDKALIAMNDLYFADYIKKHDAIKKVQDVDQLMLDMYRKLVTKKKR